MTGRLVPALAWLASATALLAGGFLLFAFALARIAAGDDGEARAALAVWAQIVLVKGLLPQLWLCLGLWALFARPLGLPARGRLGSAAGLAVAALVAGLPVAAWLLPLDLPNLPAVVFRGPANFAATVVEMSVPVWLAGLLAGFALRGRAGEPAELSGSGARSAPTRAGRGGS
jgi:hypothetical protein